MPRRGLSCTISGVVAACGTIQKRLVVQDREHSKTTTGHVGIFCPSLRFIREKQGGKETSAVEEFGNASEEISTIDVGA